MSSDDEVDYMSEEFINSCVGNNDVRPGLTQSYSTKRKHEIEKKKKENDDNYRKKLKPQKQLQEERLKEGLNTALDSSNKGFALMEKMGFKPGMSLGKGLGGIVEPIAVQLKSDRVGLGWKQLIEEKKKKLEQIRKTRQKRKEEVFDPLKYRARMSNEHNQKKIAADLNKSRKVCYELDTREGYTQAQEYWFWPTYTWEEDEDEEEDDDVEEEENQMNSQSNLQTGELLEQEQEQESYMERISIKELDELFEPSEQLQIITEYLRATYFYCLWCCMEFETQDDISAHCPGPTRADHDE